MAKYSEEQIDVVLGSEVSTFEEFIKDIITRNDSDRIFFNTVIGLLLKIYQMHKQNRFLTKMQACMYIPMRHQSGCLEYVKEAEARGYIKIVQDSADKRKFNVIPEPALIAYVENYLHTIIDEARQTVGAAASEGDIPNDNFPLAGYSAESKSKGADPGSALRQVRAERRRYRS